MLTRSGKFIVQKGSRGCGVIEMQAREAIADGFRASELLCRRFVTAIAHSNQVRRRPIRVRGQFRQKPLMVERIIAVNDESCRRLGARGVTVVYPLGEARRP
jgi:hypothetical protein